MLATLTYFWQLGLAEGVRALAFAFLAGASARLFLRPRTAVLGTGRWLLVAALAVLAALQLCLFFAWSAGLLWLVHDLDLASACLLLIAAILLFPFLRFATRALDTARSLEIDARLEAAEARAREARSWLLLAEQIAHVGHWRIDFPKHKLFWSDEIFRIHGLEPGGTAPGLDEAINAFHPQDRQKVRDAIAEAVERGAPYELQARLVRPDGEVCHVLSRGRLERGRDGAVTALFGVFVDITPQKLVEDRLLADKMIAELASQSLQELAMRDQLTGLPNRRQFDRTLLTEMNRASRGAVGFGLLMIDVDYFKQYNDCYGHPAGDDCLRRVAAAIAAVPQRPGDQTARYGGEEFVILLPGVDEPGAETVAFRVLEAVRDLGLTHTLSPTGRITASCGVAWFDPALNEGAREILHRADQALYAAKHAGRDQLAVAPACQPCAAVAVAAAP